MGIKIKELEKKGNDYKFVVEDTTASFMNELRRAFMFELPILAIEDVYFIKNSSALYDEILAHRLGLLPLKADLSKIKAKESCSCKGEGCDKCEVKFTLKLSGPCTIYAKDIKTKDKSVKILYPEMPIVLLNEGQEIELQAIAVLGRGKDHIKWGSGLAYYQRYPKIVIGSNKDKVKEGVKHCPKDVFDNSGKVINLINCDLCKSCEARSDSAIKIEGEEGKFIFTLESWGQLSPEEGLKMACDIIKEKLKEVKL